MASKRKMNNTYTRKELKCPLIGNWCDCKNKNCNDCIKKEEAWQKIQCYMDCNHYDWTYASLKEHYQKYYLPGFYCSWTLKDVIEHNEKECKLLFGDITRAADDKTGLSKCTCGCKETEQYDEYYESPYGLVEYKLRCKSCGNFIGSWAYGCFFKPENDLYW